MYISVYENTILCRRPPLLGPPLSCANRASSIERLESPFDSASSCSTYTRLVSNSAPTWSSRCCFTACHF